ncbi:MAG: peptidase S74, partial [Verrucomicrobiota bacterium]
PMAQDFHAAFGLGGSDTTITSVDPDGVALAAIQGLNEKLDGNSQKAEASLQTLRAENAELKARLERLERLLTRLPEGSSR